MQPCDCIVSEAGITQLDNNADVGVARLLAIIEPTADKTTIIAAVNKYRPVIREIIQHSVDDILYTHGALIEAEIERV